jgi:hypothetical protein
MSHGQKSRPPQHPSRGESAARGHRPTSPAGHQKRTSGARVLSLKRKPTEDLLRRLGALPPNWTGPKRLSAKSGDSLNAPTVEPIGAALGVRTTEALIPLMNQLLNLSGLLTKETPDEELHAQWLSMAAQLGELQPKTAAEAMLGVQMIGAHTMAMKFLSHINLSGQSSEGMDVNVTRAVRLMRMFAEQLEAMAKLQGKSGQQKVTVEHVNVAAGGQAIVGAVSSTRVGDGGGSPRESR